MVDDEHGRTTGAEQDRRDLDSATPNTASQPVSRKRLPAMAILTVLVVLAVLAAVAVMVVIPNGGNTP